MRQVDNRRVPSKLSGVGGSSRGWNLIKPATALAVIATALFLLMPSLASATTTGQITGKVTAATGGGAIEGIEVCAEETGVGGEYGCSSTNATGEYTISVLTTGSYKVRFSPGSTCTPTCTQQNYLTQYYNGKSSWEEAEAVSVTIGATTANINAQMHEGGQITGKVTKASGGSAIEGSEVCVYEASSGEYVNCTQTSPSGEYTIAGLPTGSYKVEFSPPYGGNYLTQYYNGKSSLEEADAVAVIAGATTANINAQMHEGGKITGKVTKATGGAAIEGVQVCARESQYEYGHCVSTNASGEYTVAGLPTGSYKVEFSPPYAANYLAQYYNGKSSWEEAEAVSVTVDTTTANINAQMHEGGQIKGKVTKAVGGAAIEGIQVCAHESQYEYGHCMTTNASGEYTIVGLPTGSYKVGFSAGTICTPTCTQQNYLTQYYNGKSNWEEAEEFAVTVGATASNINAAMQEGGKITGKVTKAAGGAAIEEVQVCARESQYDYGHCASTNASGEYTLVGLPTGSYKVAFSPPYGGNYLTQYYNGKASWEEAEAVTVTAGATSANINAQMHEGGKVTGKVTKASGGAAIEGIQVCANVSRYEYGHCTSTNASGDYTLAGLPTGSYEVEFSRGYEGGNYLTQYYNGKSTWEEADPVAVTAEATTANIDAQMHAGGQITGTVTKASGGAAIEGAKVCASGGEYGGCATTNASGEYTISALPTGSYKVEFTAGSICTESGCSKQNYLTQYYNGKSSWEEANAVSVTAGSTMSGIDAQMHEGGQITGTVTKAAGGAPIEELEVCALTASSGEYEYGHCASTNASGEYTISALPTGSYKVEFSPGYVCGEHGCYEQDYVFQYYNGKPTLEEANAVSVTAGSVTSGVDAQMHEGGHITGTVTNAAGGAAISGINVCASKVGSSEYEYAYSCASTNASGEYTISRLPTGSYKVKFTPGSVCGEHGCSTQNYLTQYYNGKSTLEEATAVSVTQETTTPNINAALRVGGQIKGTVTKASGGAAISGIGVCVSGSGEGYGRCVSTNASGEYTISGLRTGSYKVEFSPGYEGGNYLTQYYNGKTSAGEADPIAVSAGAATSNINAAMQAGGQIKGKVTKASGGAAIEGAGVCAYEAAGGYEYGGHCTSTNASGEYTISALPTGSYKVRFSPPYHTNYIIQWYNGKPSSGEADPVAVTAGSTTSNINAAMQAGGQIKGKVTKASGGAAIEEAEVCANEGGEESWSCASTNASGEYTISGLPTGSYTVEFYPPYGANYQTQYYNGKASSNEADPVAVTAGVTASNINAALQAGGKIKGTVTAASGGAAIEGAEVCAYKSGEEEPRDCAGTNLAGEYTIAGLPTGSYTVKFSPGWICGFETCTPNNYAPQFYDNKPSRATADPVAVTAGATNEGINAALLAGGEISGHVTAASGGGPLAGSSVCAYRSGETEAESCTESGLDGSYVISGLSAGSHAVEFGPGWTCGEGGCTETNYVVQFYDNKSSMATADPVSVTVGAVHEGIDAALVEPSGSKPVNTALPQLTGTPALNETLSCSNGTWENSPTSYEYAWLRDGSLISGHTGTTYTVASADQGHSLTCRVTATNGFGSASATSHALYVPGKPVNTTLPSLTGTPAVNETLSCSQGTWEHSPTSYAYAWFRGSSPIGGATATTYQVQNADQGYSITCEVTATNADGSASATSNALAVPAAVGAPVNTTPPSLTGTPAVNEMLSCSQGTWEHSPTSYAYAWRRDSSLIAGQSASTYTVQSADAGHAITCEVTASNASGPGSATSNSLQVPAKPVNTATPSLSGTPAIGQTLSCSQGTWEHSPSSYAYAWKRDGSAISGQTGSTYTVQSADAGNGITCEVTASNGGGSSSATSNALQVPAKPVNTTPPSLTGTPAVGQTLSCSQGTWEHSPTAYAFAWKRDGSAISGQTGNSYTVQSADAGHGVTCEVTASNGGGSSSAVSNSLAVPAETAGGGGGGTSGGGGTPEVTPTPTPTPKPLKCKKGFKKKKVHGKVKCVKVKHGKGHRRKHRG